MKTFLVFLASASLAASAIAADHFAAPVTPRRALPPVSAAARTEGGLQRGVRLGNPAQMFNPAAPAQYGTGEEFVTSRDQDPGLRPRDRSRSFPIGLRLLSFAF